MNRLSPKLRQRVAPAKAREAREIVVAGAQFCAMLEGDGGKLRVRYQVACGAERPEQVPQDARVALAGIDYGRARLRQPGIDQTRKCNPEGVAQRPCPKLPVSHRIRQSPAEATATPEVEQPFPKLPTGLSRRAGLE